MYGANVLFLALLQGVYRVTMDTDIKDIEDAIVVYISERHKMKFIHASHDLYVCDVNNQKCPKLENGFSFLSTVAHNKGMYPGRGIRKADQVIAYNRRINNVASDKFERILKDNLALN